MSEPYLEFRTQRVLRRRLQRQRVPFHKGRHARFRMKRVPWPTLWPGRAHWPEQNGAFKRGCYAREGVRF